MGGGGWKNPKSFEFQFGNIWNLGEGLDFSKMSEFLMILRPHPKNKKKKNDLFRKKKIEYDIINFPHPLGKPQTLASW